MDYAQKMQRRHEYVEALEKEQRKIQVFQRELPLCLELVSRAIEACRRELSGSTTEYMHGQSECSEQTTSEGDPILEEFIPIKRCSSCDEDEQESHEPKNNRDKPSNSDKKKSDWLRSVQLWNQSPDPPLKEDVPKKATVVEVKRNGGAFQPFQKQKTVAKSTSNSNQQPVGKANPMVPAASASSTDETGKREEKNGQLNQRKQRRCWSPELHRRFLHALRQLGGSHAATPRQIRELMKVDGLTNDEVKSHLQKYRLHTRRPSGTVHNNCNPQAPQFVVVGGIWVPPPEYAAIAATTAPGEAANGIYAPVAAPPRSLESLTPRHQPTQSKHMLSDERGSYSEGGVQSNSPATSSSTHTTTTSSVF